MGGPLGAIVAPTRNRCRPSRWARRQPHRQHLRCELVAIKGDVFFFNDEDCEELFTASHRVWSWRYSNGLDRFGSSWPQVQWAKVGNNRIESLTSHRLGNGPLPSFWGLDRVFTGFYWVSIERETGHCRVFQPSLEVRFDRRNPVVGRSSGVGFDFRVGSGFYRILLGLTCFYWVLLGFILFDWVFTRFYLGFTCFHWVLLGFYQVLLGFYLFSLGFTGFYCVVLVSMGFYCFWLGLTGFDWVLLDFTCFCLVLPGFTRVGSGFYWVLLGFTCFYWVLLGFTLFDWVLPGFTWVSLVSIGFYWVLQSFTLFIWCLIGF